MLFNSYFCHVLLQYCPVMWMQTLKSSKFHNGWKAEMPESLITKSMKSILFLKNYIKEYGLFLIGFLVFSIVFVVVFSTSTSFLYDYPETSDSFIFQVIGKFWNQGSIPYKDLFDNKGPFLYLMNALGYWFVDNKTGLLLVQIPFFFFTSIITFHFLLLGFNKKQSFLLSLALLLGLSLGYNGGNNACEYSLPFILYSFLLFYRWLDQNRVNEIRHPLGYSFFYGISIGFCLMTRPSNAIVVFLIVAYTTFVYLANKQIKELFSSLALVAGGSIAVCLPFILYFMTKGAMEDFYYALIESNMHYLKNTGLFESPMYLKRAVALIFSYINCLLFFVIGLIQICFNSRWKNGILWFVMSMVCIMFFVTTNCYPNYAHICLPYAVIGLLEMKSLHNESNDKRYLRSFIVVVAFCLVGINFFNGVFTAIKGAVSDKSSRKALYSAYDKIINEIPKKEYDSFVSYESLPEMLLRWNICPRCRFFALQGFSYNYNQVVYNKTNDEFVKTKAKWILVNYWKGLPNEIQDMLNDKYQTKQQLNTEDAFLVLYSLVEH